MAPLVLIGTFASVSAQAPADAMNDGDVRLVADLLRDLSAVEEKVLGLADAFTQAAYDWRPDEGVRSGGEVFMHVAAINFAFPVLAGYEAPASTGLTAENIRTAAPAYESSLTGRDEIRPALAASFETLRTAIGSSASDLELEVSVFGNPMTLRALWLGQVGHLHEHLGQLIAYGRVRGIAPPWS